MTLNEIYKLINLVSLKENNGNLFKIYDMNNAIAGIDSMFISEKIREYEKYQDNPNVKESVLAGKSLKELITSDSVAIASGYGPLPADYGYFKSAEGEYNSSLKEVELVTEEERIERLSKRFRKPVERYPVCTLRGSNLYVWPKGINPVTLLYYKFPTTPYLDYYINSDDLEVALAASDNTLQLAASETGSQGQTQVTTLAINGVASDYIQVSGDHTDDLVNAYSFAVIGSTGNDGTYTVDTVTLVSGNTRIAVNETVPDGTADGLVGTVLLSSQTVELVYNKDLHMEYAYRILSMLGIRINFPQLVQYAEGMQSKHEEK